MYKKADILQRVFAYAIDAAIANLCGLIPAVGGLLGFLYMLLRDGLMDGQSIGKKLLGLKTMTGFGPANYSDSVKRNIIFAIPNLIMVIPLVGWGVGVMVEMIIWIIEIYRVINDPYGRRNGDIWAGTQVVDEKSLM
ncbi:RDD family protein [Calorimonas adulescens]|uniref:RDD domain-containing protein n=1 Tax=Calorimonas adulescens TaxID=2606906 RepID=A0A5D8Q9S5_9THEO|nr:RDD family protein [Calorimonas adulescens]TZE80263.1 hypothetical protein FWJ32_12990 [Calorimonas adulescens]